MAYDDLKRDGEKVYTGMSVGGRHVWEYPNGLWDERKVAPDKWEFTFSSMKRRTTRAPVGSGAPTGAQYHWFLLAHQRVQKLDQDAYETLMEGVKYKLAHKRPHWRTWNTGYPGNPSEKELLISILEETLSRLKADEHTIGDSVIEAPGAERQYQ